MPVRERPDYIDRIIQDPEIMVGKPVVKGTRIPVERVILHLAHNPALQDLFAAFPELTVEDVKACLAYAHAQLGQPRRWTKQPRLLTRGGEESALVKPAKSQRRRKGGPLTGDDPLFSLIGIAGGGEERPTDVSANKHKYLAEAYQDEHL